MVNWGAFRQIWSMTGLLAEFRLPFCQPPSFNVETVAGGV